MAEAQRAAQAPDSPRQVGFHSPPPYQALTMVPFHEKSTMGFRRCVNVTMNCEKVYACESFVSNTKETARRRRLQEKSTCLLGMP
eukprot:scaffold677786_cov66-Prasinocladus_malaysianus.AAC.1